jgi:hypothetical protein
MRGKLKAIAEQYKAKRDVEKLGTQIAHDFSDEKDGKPRRNSLLAIPFAAARAMWRAASSPMRPLRKYTGAWWSRTADRLAWNRLPPIDLSLAMDHARELHSLYVLWGTVDGEGAAQVLTVKIIEVEDGSVEWSKSYPVAGADPAKIAKDVDSHVPSLDDN